MLIGSVLYKFTSIYASLVVRILKLPMEEDNRSSSSSSMNEKVREWVFVLLYWTRCCRLLSSERWWKLWCLRLLMGRLKWDTRQINIFKIYLSNVRNSLELVLLCHFYSKVIKMNYVLHLSSRKFQYVFQNSMTTWNYCKGQSLSNWINHAILVGLKDYVFVPSTFYPLKYSRLMRLPEFQPFQRLTNWKARGWKWHFDRLWIK